MLRERKKRERSRRGQTGGSPVLVQRAVWEDVVQGWVMNWKRGSMHALWGTVSHHFDDGRARN